MLNRGEAIATKHQFLAVILSAVCFWLAPSDILAEDDYLSAGEVVAIGGTSITMAWAGGLVKKSTAESPPGFTTPSGFDAWFTRKLGGKARVGKMNFMDTDGASFASTVTTGMLVLSLDAAYPRVDKGKDIAQNQFLFYSGALAQKGVHDLFKGLVLRQRPLGYYHSDLAGQVFQNQPADRNHSFYSGHSSVAFYAMTFLNKRVREALRGELSASEFKRYGWLAPTLTYGWATFVAYSRVHAYKHYFTDVLMGALAGWLIGELFYYLGELPNTGQNGSAGSAFVVRIPLP